MLRVTVSALAVTFFALTPLADTAVAAAPAQSATLLVSTTGSDGNPCSQAAPCATLNRAYRAAQPGQTVQLAAGSYPDEEIDADPAKPAGPPVRVEPAPHASVYVLKLAFGDGEGTPAASNVTVRALQAGEMQAFTPARNLVWQGLTAGNFYVRGVQNLRIQGGSWGPCGSRGTPNCGGNNKIDYPQGEQPNDHITIDGALFHDYRIENPADHYECLFIAGGTNITVRNSRFVNCEFFDVFAQYSGGPFDGLTLSGNRLGTPWNGQGVANRSTAIELSPRGTPFSNVLVQRNSFADGTAITWNDEGRDMAYKNVRASGNIFGTAPDCYPSVAFQANLASDASACGAGDVRAPYGYAVTNGTLAPVPGQAARVQRAFALASAGTKLARVARATGWSLMTLRRILGDRVYLGGAWGAPGAQPALVTRSRWIAAQKRR